MKFSLIVCTYNRISDLNNCLNSLKALQYDDYEIIIIDQSDIINHELQYSNTVTYIHIKDIGLSHARNLALKIASGEYICLVDDDATYDVNYLLNASKVIDKYPNLGVLSGRIIDPNDGRLGVKGMMKENEYKIRTTQEVFSFCMSACCIIKADIAIMEKFDERFGVGAQYGAGEETDIIWRIIYKGYSILYTPSLKVYHRIYKKDKLDLEKVKKYNMAFGALYAKHFLYYRKIAIFMFVFSLFKSFIGCALFIFNDKLRTYYLSSLIYKLYGFKKFITTSVHAKNYL